MRRRGSRARRDGRHAHLRGLRRGGRGRAGRARRPARPPPRPQVEERFERHRPARPRRPCSRPRPSGSGATRRRVRRRRPGRARGDRGGPRGRPARRRAQHARTWARSRSAIPTRFVVDHAPCPLLLVWPPADRRASCRRHRPRPCSPQAPLARRAVQTLGLAHAPGPVDAAPARPLRRRDHACASPRGHVGAARRPGRVKQVFTGDPADLHAGEAQRRCCGRCSGRAAVLLLDEAPHMAQRKLLLPPFHGERMQAYGELIAEIAAREVDDWPAGEPHRHAPAHAGAHARGDHARGLRRRATSGCGRALARMLDWTTDPRRLALVAALGPDRIERLRLFRARARPGRRAAGRRDRRPPRAPTCGEDILSLLIAARRCPTPSCATSC